METEGNSPISQSGRLSLGGTVSQNNPARGVSQGHVTRPQRKSLPSKLPSASPRLSSAPTREKTKQVKATNSKNSIVASEANEGKATPPDDAGVIASLVQKHMVVSTAETSKPNSQTVDSSVIEEHVQAIAVQDPLVVEKPVEVEQ